MRETMQPGEIRTITRDKIHMILCGNALTNGAGKEYKTTSH